MMRKPRYSIHFAARCNRRVRKGASFHASWLLALLFPWTAVGQDHRETDWHARSTRVGGFTCAIEEVATYQPDWLQRMGFKPSQPGGILKEIQCRRTWRLRTDGQRYFVWRAGELPNQKTGALTTDDRQVAFDGVTQTALSAPDANREFSDVVIESRPMDLEQLTLKPLWWYVRFDDPRGMGCPGNRFQAVPSDSDESLLRVDCIGDRGGFELDARRDHVPVRYWNRRENPLVTVDIEYSDALPVRPVKWTITSLGEGKPEVISVCRVTEWREQQTFADEDFQLEIPPGTLIHDRRSGGTYQLKDAQGRIQSLSRNEVDTDVIQHRIRNSPPPGVVRNRWFLGVQAVLLTVLVSIAVRVRLHRNGK